MGRVPQLSGFALEGLVQATEGLSIQMGFVFFEHDGGGA
jgi:hypothetical protein